MKNIPVLVIYHNGEDYKVKTAVTDYPDSSMPHVHGLLPDEDTIVAVIANPGKNFTVYIDEERVLGVEL